MDFISVLIALSSVFVVVSSQQGLNATCRRRARESDDCLRHAILIGREDFVLPRTIRDVDRLVCSTLNRDVRCINELRECLEPFPRTLFNVVMKSMEKGIKTQFCGTPAVKRRIVRGLKCVKSPDQISTLYNILDRFAATADYVSTNSAVDSLLPHSCCLYFDGLEEAKKIMNTLCDGDRKLVDIILGIVSTLFDDVVDLGCGSYDNVLYCEAKEPTTMGQIRKVWNNQTERFSSSPVIPALTILHRLGAKITI